MHKNNPTRLVTPSQLYHRDTRLPPAAQPQWCGLKNIQTIVIPERGIMRVESACEKPVVNQCDLTPPPRAV